MITQTRLKELFHYDPETGVFTRIVALAPKSKVGDLAGWHDPKGYLRIGTLGTNYLAHRLAWLYMHGEMPVEIDHINGIKDDNRLSNLRSVNRKQNMENRRLRKDSSSGFCGANFHKATGRWRAQIRHNGKKLHLGYFDSAEEAAQAYHAAALKLFTHYTKEVRK